MPLVHVTVVYAGLCAALLTILVMTAGHIPELVHGPHLPPTENSPSTTVAPPGATPLAAGGTIPSCTRELLVVKPFENVRLLESVREEHANVTGR